MMATGTTDPIRRATDKTWSNTLPLLTIEGSAGPDNAADAIYCQVYGGAECASWYTNSISTTDDRWIGWEMDWKLDWRIMTDVNFNLRYGVFFPGDAMPVGLDDARHFVYGGISYSF